MDLMLVFVKEATKQAENTSFLTTVKEDILPVAISILTIIGLIRGLLYISSMKDKQRTAVFGFWSQLIIRLKRIKDELSAHPGLLNNMYPEGRRLSNENGNADGERREPFKKIVDELGDFLKTAPDQMPAYSGWSEDLHTIISFVSDINTYDLLNAERFFVSDTFEDRNDYEKKICETMDVMIKNIKIKQQGMEKKLNRNKFLRFFH